MKVILIIDQPDSCDKCPLFSPIYSDMCCTASNNRGINYPYPKDFRQKWCPLKSLPVKHDIDNIVHTLDCNEDFKRGYNACIDEILNS